MQLDHATIVTDDIEGTRRFFEDVAGLHAGPRPPFRVDGFWLYLGGRPAIHVTQATVAATPGLCAPRIDHIALRIDDANEWGALVDRLHRSNTPYDTAVVPLSQEVQLFVSIGAGVNIEFVTGIHIRSAAEDAFEV
ncbi:Extradiol dioxygenase [Pararobbsia alpina]|uniref:VOC family protein n=1 Tax=Pararobbsia alpina TaxID=621374 RepID=UPI0039A58950